MRFFVTGASGWIGSAVVRELLDAGHDVVGLARSDTAAEAVDASGAQVVRGEIGDLDLLRRTAEKSDGVVHLAFRHDIAFGGDFETAVESDLAAITALGDALAGSDRPMAIASGVAGLNPGTVITETDDVPQTGAGGRIGNERVALALADRGVRSVSVRFAPTVHGAGDNGFLAMVVAADRANEEAAYVGDGTNRWPAVHRSDAARLVRLAVESAPPGSVLHAVGEEGVALRDIASVIGRGLGLPIRSISAQDAAEHFGFLGGFLGLDIPASSVATQRLMSWQPTGPTLLEDLEAGHYFAPRGA